MAEKVINKLDEQINCSICLDTYTDPKLLQCFHTYCTKCLIPLVRNRQGQLTLTCPACRQVTPIPPNGVRALQSAFQINDLIGIRDDLKKVKDLFPSQKPGVEGDATSQTPSKNGKIFSPGSPDPSQCYATGKGLEVAVVGKKSSAVLQAVNYNCAPCEEPIQSLQCELVSEIKRATVRGSLERRGQSQYKISYQPTIKGRHQLHIKVEDQHIRGSPFLVEVTSPIKKFSTPIHIGGVEGPWGITFNQRGEVVVADRNGDCVSIFSSSGEEIRSFGTCGSDQGQFNEPCGVAVDGEGNILVADSSNHRIQKFTEDGQFLTTVGTRGNGRLQFNYPRGLTFNATNDKVYVADALNHRVQVLNSDLTYSYSFGKECRGWGQFC